MQKSNIQWVLPQSSDHPRCGGLCQSFWFYEPFVTSTNGDGCVVVGLASKTMLFVQLGEKWTKTKNLWIEAKKGSAIHRCDAMNGNIQNWKEHCWSCRIFCLRLAMEMKRIYIHGNILFKYICDQVARRNRLIGVSECCFVYITSRVGELWEFYDLYDGIDIFTKCSETDSRAVKQVKQLMM